MVVKIAVNFSSFVLVNDWSLMSDKAMKRNKRKPTLMPLHLVGITKNLLAINRERKHKFANDKTII